MRQVLSLALGASVVACAMAPQTQLYRPQGEEGSAGAISGEFDSVTKTLQVLIDGEPAAAGKSWYYDPSGTIRGSHNGHPVRAECVEYQDSMGGTLMVLCDVFVDDERAAFLTLN